ncbi:phosphoesterase [Streptomyces spinoverrucosus]|uniref:Phosphoesterase n=1 Tax=Streptomyces spinoverrucosus TaxID=284043 RepID=A0A4Y3VY42_9ACTN|nr:CehA/McbA family metallohydrolase [Streptomyces spinoverrucosus]GEC10661.1 phosphoesterase [Streptomyces spinoverrucosus]GHB99208.1 phosphoesterase [Streptomyces spinoverrucosus]
MRHRPSRHGSFAAERRDILKHGAALLTGGLASTIPAGVAHAGTGAASGSHGISTMTHRGHSPFGFDQWASADFEVPEGVQRVSVSTSFDPFVAVPGVMENVLDIGLFDPTGFRGWSGGARRDFTVSAADATPGYIPGDVQPGTWSVALGPIVYNPKGMGWEVRITLEFGEPADRFVPRPAPDKAIGRGQAWYRGDMHLHTQHSDGTATHSELIKSARDHRLDFIASTEHNTRSSALYWGASAPSDLLVLNGEEVTTRHGHWLALGLPPTEWVDWRYGPRDGSAFAQRRDRVRSLGGLVVAAHPMTPGPGSFWEFGFENVDALEVWSGPWTLDDVAAVAVWDGMLRTGRRIVAVGNSDAHNAGEVGTPHTVVRATSLSKDTILDGVRRGNSYLAETADVSLDFIAAANGRQAGPGDQLPVSLFSSVEVSARVSGAPGTTVTVHTAWGRMATTTIGSTGTGEVHWKGWGKASGFARVEVRRQQPTSTTLDQMVAISNPIWFI